MPDIAKLSPWALEAYVDALSERYSDAVDATGNLGHQYGECDSYGLCSTCDERRDTEKDLDAAQALLQQVGKPYGPAVADCAKHDASLMDPWDCPCGGMCPENCHELADLGSRHPVLQEVA